MSNVPAAVKKQIAEAQKVHAQMYSTDGAEDNPTPEVVQEGTQQDGNTDVAGTEQDNTVVAEGSEQQNDVQQPVEDAWEQRYNVLKGKYDSEVPKQAAEIRELRQDLAAMRTLIAQQGTQPEKEEPEKPKAPETLIKQEEVDDYGAELIDVIRRGAREVFNVEIVELKQKLEAIEQQLGNVGQTLAVRGRETVVEVLNREVPNWKTVNTDTEWLGWLDQVDPLSGVTRQQLLDAATKDNDAARVVAFFKNYLSENALAKDDKGQKAPDNRNTDMTLENLVAPGKPNGAPEVAHKGGETVWTDAKIRKFYRDVAAGKVSDLKERTRIEKEIVAAVRNGKVTG